MDIFNEIRFWLMLISIVLITLLLYRFWEIIKQLNEKINQENEFNKKTFKREHTKINPVSFSNPIQGRKNLYKEYENEKGLYEPVIPTKGVKIKKEVK